jgi:phage gp29-like protein
MDLLILGQTLTTDVSKQGGSRALGEVHAGVREEIVQAAAKFAASLLNTQLIPSILELNYGETTEPPEFRPTRAKPDNEMENARRDATLLAAGVDMPRGWFFKRHRIPLPRPEERTLGGPGGIHLRRFDSTQAAPDARPEAGNGASEPRRDPAGTP